MAIIDDTGVWRSLGSISANQDWAVMPLACTTPYSSFRLIWTPLGSLNRAKIENQFYYLRQIFFTGFNYLLDANWIRVYPSETPTLIEIPYPPDLINEPLSQRQIEVKLRTKSRIGYTTYSLWNLQILEKQTSNVLYPTSPAIIGEGSGIPSEG